MAYTVDVLAREQALALRLFGTITIDDRAEGLVASLSKLHATGFKRILVDLRNGVMQHTPIEICSKHAANLASTFSHLPDVRIAYVYEAFHHPTPVEMIAAARGFYFETFTHVDSAMGWLGGTAPAFPCTWKRQRGGLTSSLCRVVPVWQNTCFKCVRAP